MKSLETLVIALGGNAIIKKGMKGSPEEQWRTVRSAVRQLLRIAADGVRLVITHGNGPQVGYLLEAFEALPRDKPRQSLDLAVAMTQGWIGYLIAHALEREATRLGINVKTATVVTRVVVSSKDPAFRDPSKFIGSYYTREEAEELARRHGWVFKRDPRGLYRRVVPSPRPIKILESKVVEGLVKEGYIAIAVGGGGIPVTEDLEPVEAVIDKDLASSLLAQTIKADRFIILTDVRGVALNYGRPGEMWLERVSVDELEAYHHKGYFPPGSMGPKVEAVIEYVRKTGKRASIGSLDEAYSVYRGDSGTHVEPGKP
ncbi:MAG: carbamate kinase [Desulfurococcales archaeon]|nr:carbamate kinase [Desulfurococcales archaeon]